MSTAATSVTGAVDSRDAAGSPRTGIVIGVLALVAGLLCNKWFIERVVSRDEFIARMDFIAVIVLLQVLLVAFGVFVLWRRPRIIEARMLAVPIGAGLLAVSGAAAYGGLKASGVIDPDREFRHAWERMVHSEELLLALTPKLKHLSSGVLNLKLPDAKSRALFADTVALVDLSDHPGTREVRQLPGDIEVWRWPTREEARTGSRDELALWRPLLTRVAHFEHAKFYFVTGQLSDPDRDRFEASVGFAGLARLVNGELAGVKSKQQVVWHRGPGEGPDAWRIAKWTTKKVEVETTPSLLFEEVLEKVLPPEQARRARRSLHQQLALDYFAAKEKGTTELPEFFDLIAFDRQPGVSVADIDGNGFDDIYVMARFGRNELYLNRGDGTFEEGAARYGLDIDSHTSSAVFADFDNDGDLDAFLARTLARSLYLVNENGRYVDASDRVDIELPFLASTLALADYDGDGLLDLYVSTYSYRLGRKGREVYGRYLPDSDAAELERLITKSETSHRFMSFPGAPNILLRNVGGGRFAHAVDVPELKLYWNTWQSAWTDFDGDGDPDLYVSNDFAPNQLMRNDGNGRFVDITAETGTADYGFGMGASWGDYDQDGKPDLYVTNMFSKAGRRITAQVPGIDQRLADMSRGNTLFRNASGRFDRVSGLEPPALTVEEGGWGWSGQFVDVDNDTYLDIHSLSGFYTSVANVLPVDT